MQSRKEREKFEESGWIGQTLDFPSSDRSLHLVCDYESRKICFCVKLCKYVNLDTWHNLT